MNSVLNRSSKLPLHRQVEAWLRRQIEEGAFPAGEMLPSVRDLCLQLGGINHQTVRMAMSHLVQAGVIYAIQGRGTFVKSAEMRQLRVALVLPNIDDEITREIANGVHDVFEEHDLKAREDGGSAAFKAAIVMMDSRHSAEREIANVRHLEDMPLDGAIIFPVLHGNLAMHLVRLQADNFPVVFVDCAIPGIEFPAVTVDNYRGSYDATMHLLKAGKARLAWIGGKSAYSTASARHEGFRDAICDYGLALDRRLCFTIDTPSPTDPFEDSVTEIVEKLISDRDRMPDAIVCSSDMYALLCLELLPRRGISVPDNIAIVGFDDRKAAASSTPALTTVRQPSREVGRHGAKLMLDWLASKVEPVSIELPVTLVKRGSA